MSDSSRKIVILAGTIIAYFTAFPSDAEAILGISNAISPWLYGFAAIGLIAWSIVKVWGTQSITDHSKTTTRY
jgi:hypothetical protein